MTQKTDLYPKMTATAKVARIGPSAVASVVNEELGWMFRETHQEDDFGIDGYIDIVDDNGSVTGQSLAVQIKTGKSFLRTTSSAGFVYMGDAKHLNYYLNHAIPILIVICDPEDRSCYWEAFDAGKTEEAPAGWKMIVPFSNRLSVNSKEALYALVGPAQDHLSEVQRHWAFTKALHEADRVMLVINRRDVISFEFDSVATFFQRLTFNPTTSTKLQGKIVLTISGYEDDPRELWEIGEVRKWLQAAAMLVDVWFFFLAPDAGVTNSLKLMTVCICETVRVGVVGGIQKLEVDFASGPFLKFMENNYLGLNRLTMLLGIDDRNEEISMAVVAALGIPQ